MREDSLVIANADDSTSLDAARFGLKSDSFQTRALGSSKSDTDSPGAPPLDSVLTPARAALADPLARNHFAPAFKPLSLPAAQPHFGAPAVGRTIPHHRRSQVRPAIAVSKPRMTPRSVRLLLLSAFALAAIIALFRGIFAEGGADAPPPLALGLTVPATHVEATPLLLAPEREASASLDEAPIMSSSTRARADAPVARVSMPLPVQPSPERTGVKPNHGKERIPWWE